MSDAAGSAVSLVAGDLRLELAPELGGSVSCFTHAGRHLMRPLSVPRGQAPHALHSGMFPMMPFANSLRDNRFELDGRRYQVQPNMAGVRLNYHGSGWQRPWRVLERQGDYCRLVLPELDEAPDYSFAGEQRFRLGSDRLDVDVAVTNRSPRRMPFGLGLHPWFPRHGDARVAFEAQRVLVEDGDFNAVDLAPIRPEQDFANGLVPPRSYQNRCYAGWHGTASISWPGLHLALVIEADPVFEHLMFHVPAHDFDTFCLEPQSNRTSGFDGLDSDAPAPGVHVLDPGETLQGRISFNINAAQ